MQFSPIDIATARTEQTVELDRDVKITVVDVRPHQTCFSVDAPSALKVSVEVPATMKHPDLPERTILVAGNGVRMVGLRVGETLRIGPHVTAILLTVTNNKVRLGVGTPKKPPHVEPVDCRTLKC